MPVEKSKLPPFILEAIDNGVSERTNKPLSADTKKTYKTNLSTLYTDYSKERVPDFTKMIQDIPSTSKLISKHKNIHTKLALISAVNMLFKRVPLFQGEDMVSVQKKWSELQKTLNEEYETIRDQNKLTDKQKTKFQDIESLRKIFDTHYKEFEKEKNNRTMSDSQWSLFVKRLLILALYVLHPPTRQDYGCVRLYKTKKSYNTNHIVIPINTLVLSEYKTSETYGRVESVLPTQVRDILKASLEVEPRKWLFVKGNGQPYRHTPKDSNSFTTLVNRSLSELVGNRIDVTSIRRAFASWIAKQDITFAERKRIAQIMGHSVLQNMQYQVVGGGIQVGGEHVPTSSLSDVEIAKISLTTKSDKTEDFLNTLTLEQKERLRERLNSEGGIS